MRAHAAAHFIHRSRLHHRNPEIFSNRHNNTDGELISQLYHDTLVCYVYLFPCLLISLLPSWTKIERCR